MNPIKLTEEHKSKLLEMCKELFTEYTYHEFNTDVEGNWGDDILCLYNPGDIKSINIHWFEFCMTHLSRKIFNKLHDFSNHMTADYEQECSDEWDAELMQRCSFFVANPTRNLDKYPNGKIIAWHPIDYLYEEFKKLKS